MTASRRVAAVDIVRALAMALMMIDHVREFFFLHRQVADPVDLHASGLALFFTRAASHICAPAFVLLAGLAVAFRRDRRGDGLGATARQLVRRGLLLILLEVTLVNFAWTFRFSPAIIYLQVIWAIGLSMIALAGLIHLPWGALLATSLVIILGHDTLTAVGPRGDTFAAFFWSVLHHRARFALTDAFTLRVSYPVLPYVGVIGLGYALGRLYAGRLSPATRRAWLGGAGTACLVLFLILRPPNLYGDPGRFEPGGSPLATLASLLNTTKYPPSPLFLLMTLGPTFILLAVAERFEGRFPAAVARFGAAPMLYYLLHLYLLHASNAIAAVSIGTAGLFSFDRVTSVWAATLAYLAVAGPLTVWLARWGRQAATPPAPSLRDEPASPPRRPRGSNGDAPRVTKQG